MTEPPPNNELDTLIALEKGALVDPGAARARLAFRLASRFPVATPPKTSKAPFWRSGAAAGAALFGAGLVVGAGLRSLVPQSPPKSEVRYVERVVEVIRVPDGGASREAPVVVAAEAPGSAPIRAGSSAPPKPERAPSAAPSASVMSSDEDLAKERQVIEKARSALARRDAESALAAVDEHARLFPRGQLIEMREALAVQALVYAGRAADARARADQFHRRFPSSMYRPVVDGAISSIP
jgi:hypothetical protein